MCKTLEYRLVSKHEIFQLAELEKENWLVGDEEGVYIIFSDNSIDVGVVECSFDNGVAFIQMIEVLRSYRKKTYGKRIIRTLQKEFDKWKCVPIDTSEALFRSMDFVPEKLNSQIWGWSKLKL